MPDGQHGKMWMNIFTRTRKRSVEGHDADREVWIFASEEEFM
jgi:hypothetical protein